MDRRRRGAVLASSGAVLVTSATLLAKRSHGGATGDFLGGAIIGLAIAMILFALVLIRRGRQEGCS